MASSILVHEAVKTWWDSQVFTADYDGPFDSEAPEGSQFPFVVFAAPEAGRNWRSNVSEGWKVPFRLSIYDRTKALCKAHATEIAEAIEASTGIATSSGTTFLQLRLMSELYIQEEQGVNKAVLTFDVDWAKPRAG